MKAFKCKQCGEERPEKFAFGYKGACMKCRRQRLLDYQREYYRNWYAKNGRERSSNYADVIVQWAKQNTDSVKASTKIQGAIKRWLLVKPKNCVLCGREGVRINGHHNDYDFPLEVIWVCSSCHKLIHLQTT